MHNKTTIQTEKEIKLSINSETQARIFPKISGETSSKIADRLIALFSFAKFQIIDKKTIKNEDDYFDTEELHIAHANRILRVRKTNFGFQVTIKNPESRDIGTFTRKEIEFPITAEDYDSYKKTHFCLIVREYFAELIGKPIIHTATVHNERIQLVAQREEEEYKIAIDRLFFIEPVSGKQSPQRIEIEVEAVSNAAKANINSIKNGICNVYPEFEVSNKTKYEMAIDYRNQVQHILKTDHEQDVGYNIALVRLTKIKQQLDLKARRYARQSTWLFVVTLIVLWSSLAVLIYYLGWDIMEPWTYLIGIGASVGGYLYFAVTNREISPKEILDHMIETKRMKIYKEAGFDIQEYQSLLENPNSLSE